MSMSDAATFLNALFRPGDTILFRPIETWTDQDGRKQARVARRHVQYHHLGRRDDESPTGWTDCPKLLESTIEQLNRVGQQERANIFFGVCPRFGGGGHYDKAWQIRTVRCLWSDVDGTDPETVESRCGAAGLPRPSVVVRSGNGVHVYWLLGEPWVVDDAGEPPALFREKYDPKKKQRPYIKQDGEAVFLTAATRPVMSEKALFVQDIVAGIAQKIGGDHTHDLSRILRVPGTLNRKDERNKLSPKPCVMERCEIGEVFAIDDFRHFGEASKPARERKAIRQIEPPKPRKMTPKRFDKLTELVNRCIVADVGQRSERDYHLCCVAVENAWPKTDVWKTVQWIGKFEERGEPYFEDTWAKATQSTKEKIYARTKKESAVDRKKRHELNGKADSHPPGDGQKEVIEIRNADVVDMGDTTQTVPLSMDEVVSLIYKSTDNWPRQVDGVLFVNSEKKINLLKNTSAWFGWLERKSGVIDWRKSTGCVTKEEVFHELCRTSIHYDCVEVMPHEPPIPTHYYACDFPESGDGSALKELVGKFAPETTQDEQLIKAMFATAFWGGRGGSRPAFMIVSDSGRGAGKSKITDMLSHLCGGHIELAQHEDAAKIRERLLSPGGMSKRIARLDNIKTLKLSWADLESLITSPFISGRRMYHGEGCRPNTLVWLLTLNGPSLSTDMAQRAITIKIVRPKLGGKWESDVFDFIDRNRQQIIADIIGFLRSPARELYFYTRWSAWEAGVLSRLENPEEIQRLIASRCGLSDSDREEIEMIEEFFGHQLAGHGFNIVTEKIHIPLSVVCQWYNAVMGDRKNTISVSKIINQFINEGRTKNLIGNPCRANGRGLIWFGVDSTDKTVDYDLIKKIEARMRFE